MEGKLVQGKDVGTDSGSTAMVREDYLNGEYLQKNPSFHVEDSPWKAAQILRMLEMKSLRPRKVAEVGSGAGEILVQLSQRLPETYFDGYEISPQGFELAQTRQSERIRFFNCDLLKEGEGDYDLILCIDVFEHIEDYFTFLRRLRGKGRAFLFHIPLDMNAQMVVRGEPITRVRNEVGHLHYFSKETALATLEDCGYKVESWFFTASGADRPKSAMAKLLKVPRRVGFSLAPEWTVRLLGGYSLLVYAT
jgi:cyclopropane fatty-acyl-phospholipid synthase-like methyltransferase